MNLVTKCMKFCEKWRLTEIISRAKQNFKVAVAPPASPCLRPWFDNQPESC